MGNGPGGEAGAGRARQRHLEPPELCSCQPMEPAEAAALTVDFACLGAEDGLLRTLEEMGAAIVTGVLSAEEAAAFERLLAEDLAELVDGAAAERAGGPVLEAWLSAKERGVLGWPAASLMMLGGMGGAFLQRHGLPHGRFAWAARLHPKVRAVYEHIYGSSDLVVSCDNPFAASDEQEESEENGCWPHVDQNLHDPRYPMAEWKVYQGLLYARSSEARRASTTALWPGSHREAYRDCMEDPDVQRYGAAGNHLTRIGFMQPGGARDRLIQGWAEAARRVPVPAGALLLWNSRTFHQSWIGGPRVAQPLCWEPRARRDAAAHERKLRLAALGLPSTHWASLGLPHTLSENEPPVGCPPGMTRFGPILPLRPCIRYASLADGASPKELWQRLGGMSWLQPLPAELRGFLEASLSEEVKAVL